jgi:hypothetical protein
MICNAESLSEEQKIVVESLLGRAVEQGEAISLRIVAAQPVPEWLEESWKSAERLGVDGLSMDEIDAEIATARSKRRNSVRSAR